MKMNKLFTQGFGERLKEERERLGLSQDDFAAKAGVKRPTQYLYEVEQNSPNYRYLKAIAEIGVDIQYLLYGKKHNPESLELNLDILKSIFLAVEECGRDDKGQLLPIENRLEFYIMLCAAYSGRDKFDMDSNVIKKLMIK